MPTGRSIIIFLEGQLQFPQVVFMESLDGVTHKREMERHKISAANKRQRQEPFDETGQFEDEEEDIGCANSSSGRRV